MAQAHGDEHEALDLPMAAETGGHHSFPHPIMAHMGMPDEPGETSLRLTSVEQRSAGLANSTYAFHVESGIIDRLGLHLRNDGVRSHATSEMMLQYAVLRSESKSDGIALFTELDFPTGSTADSRVNGLYGISFAYQLPSFVAINSTIHYNPRDQMSEWEIAFVGKMTATIYPVIELRGEIMKDKSLTNMLAGWKFKLPQDRALAIAYQFPISDNREYDGQLLLQGEIGFQ